MTAPRRIALFGGTFDPVHAGHLEIAAKAVTELKLDTVVFIPCHQSPHKTTEPGADGPDRLSMLKRATARLPWALVDDLELSQPPPSYTWETVRTFQERFPPPHQLFLLIGEDQWQKLPSWKEHEFLARTLTFIVVGRGNQPVPRPGHHAHFLTGDHPASSTQIREQLRNDLPARWLPSPVASFIREKALYSCSS